MLNDHKLAIRFWAEEDRPREKLNEKGKHTLTDAELLAIVIGSGSSSLSALDLSKQILASVNNDLVELSKCSIPDFKLFKGIGEVKAVCITAALELGRRRSQTTVKPAKKVVSDKDVFDILSPILSDLFHEEFWIICLNRNGKFISKHKISSGGVSGTVADMKIIFNIAIKALASGIILCHNHPSGNLTPSESDKQLTKKAYDGGKLLEIEILDHIIIAHDKYFSFRANNLL